MQRIKQTLRLAWDTARQCVVDTVHDQLAGVLSHETLVRRVAENGGGQRSRVFPPLTPLGLFVAQALEVDASCQQAADHAADARVARGLAPNSPNTGPYCKARQRLALSLIEHLSQDVAAAGEAEANPGASQGRVLLIDGTTVSMPDTLELQDVLLKNHQQKPGVGFPQARIVGVISLASASVLHWRVSACEGSGSHESQHLWQRLAYFKPGDTVVADRAYASYGLLAALAQRGIGFVIREHQRRQTDRTHAQRLGACDYRVTWQKPKRSRWMARATHAALPDQLTIRAVDDGRLIVTTNCLDAHAVPANRVIQTYRQRWHIELDFRSIKSVMGMAVLRCQSPALIHKEIVAHCLAYNLIRATMARAASGPASVRDLSFATARRAVAHFQSQRRHNPQASLCDALALLDQRIAYHVIPSRPGRAEPRAAKRRPKAQRWLNQSRHEARQELKAA